MFGRDREKKPKPATPQEVSTEISSHGNPFLIWLASKTIGIGQRQRLYTRLAAPISAGVPIQSAIGQLYQRAAFKNETETMAIMLRYVMYSLNEGKTFSDGLAPFIPLSELLVIRSGEAKGELAEGLYKAAETVKAVRRIKTAVKSALLKPGLLVAMLFLAMFIVGSFVVPKIDAVFPSDQWKGGAAVLAGISNWTTSVYFPMTIAALLALVLGIWLSLKRWSRGWRRKFDKVAPYSLYRILQGAGWLTTLSAMLQSGRSVSGTLADLESLARADGNAYMAESTRRIIIENERGADNIGRAMEKSGIDFPDEEIISDLVMQSSLRNFDEQIGVIAEQWISDSVENTQATAGRLTAICMIFVGIFIACFVFGVMSLNQQIASGLQSF